MMPEEIAMARESLFGCSGSWARETAMKALDLAERLDGDIKHVATLNHQWLAKCLSMEKEIANLRAVAEAANSGSGG